MTLAEFKVRAYGYRRKEQWNWAKFRLVGWMAQWAFNIAPKSLPKSPSKVMELPFVDDGVNDNGLSDKQISTFKAAYDRYLDEKKRKEIE